MPRVCPRARRFGILDFVSRHPWLWRPELPLAEENRKGAYYWVFGGSQAPWGVGGLEWRPHHRLSQERCRCPAAGQKCTSQSRRAMSLTAVLGGNTWRPPKGEQTEAAASVNCSWGVHTFTCIWQSLRAAGSGGAWGESHGACRVSNKTA